MPQLAKGHQNISQVKPLFLQTELTSCCQCTTKSKYHFVINIFHVVKYPILLTHTVAEWRDVSTMKSTRSSATAEKQRVSWACLPRLANSDRGMHRTPQNHRGCTISDIQMLWFKTSWPKTHFVMKWPLKVIQGHSLCNHVPVDILSHIIACRISEVFEAVAIT